MKENRKINSRMIAVTGLLLAIEIILQLMSILIPGTINVNLSLIPIAFGAIFYGPIVGGFLGFACGVVVLCSPNTVSVFMSINPLATVFTCLTKTLIAGVVAGLIAKMLKEKHDLLGAIICSILVPVLNTAIFAIFSYFCFPGIMTIVVLVNFVIELLITGLITPLLYKVIKKMNENKYSH